MTKVIDFQNVSFVRGGNSILHELSWGVEAGQKWVILGPNGAGKTTLIKLVSTAEHPSSGTVDILGNRLGAVDIFELRSSIGVVTRAQEKQIPESEKVIDVVLTAAYSIAGRWREQYDAEDVQHAMNVLTGWQLAHLAERRFGSLSDGERKRVLLARAVMADPELLLLDEPAASVDLGGREFILQALGMFATAADAPAIVMVTHHVEEIPAGFTHMLLLDAQGQVAASGELGEVLTGENLSRVFGIELELMQSFGRYSARAKF
ncbi:ABC transporter ATP-binding protein [Canibacter sp. lx-72]|uniref:ABC transporter ATP-binding protein n=1 Tax=Canibacter zhuwentaonis TaxID=2837491 RepID=UPI001BDCE238|nr:ABC transporter ATP-binding protein [Canibacter zhuwentaonis]MBT1017841.1 ABC transporter ATP-binding protein [Canibacter zhuwentaonis]